MSRRLRRVLRIWCKDKKMSAVSVMAEWRLVHDGEPKEGKQRSPFSQSAKDPPGIVLVCPAAVGLGLFRVLRYDDIPPGDSTSVPQELDRVVRRVVKDVAEKYKIEAAIGIVEARTIDVSHREVRPRWRVDVTECEIS